MADDASRLWNLSDNELLAHFNSNYPQARSGKLADLRPRIHFVDLLLYKEEIGAECIRGLRSASFPDRACG